MLFTHVRLAGAAFTGTGGRVELHRSFTHQKLDALPIMPYAPLPVFSCLAPGNVLKVKIKDKAKTYLYKDLDQQILYCIPIVDNLSLHFYGQKK